MDNNVKVEDHCHITEKFRGSAHRDNHNNVKLNDEIPVVFHNLRKYLSHPFIQEPDKFNIKKNVIEKLHKNVYLYHQ